MTTTQAVILARGLGTRMRTPDDHAPLSAAQAAAADSGVKFVVINSDNYYPVEALAELHRRAAPALVAFARDALVSMGNVPPDRVARFGALEIDAGGFLQRIIATPEPPASGGPPMVASLNCWRFTREIFRACRAVSPSARGELELPQAVQLAIGEGWMMFEAVRVRAGVLDMSSRADVASVAERLTGTRVALQGAATNHMPGNSLHRATGLPHFRRGGAH